MGIFESDSQMSRFKSRHGIRISKASDLKSYVDIQDSKKRAFRILEGLYGGRILEEMMVDLKHRVEREIKAVYEDVTIDDEDLMLIINVAAAKAKIK